MSYIILRGPLGVFSIGDNIEYTITDHTFQPDLRIDYEPNRFLDYCLGARNQRPASHLSSSDIGIFVLPLFIHIGVIGLILQKNIEEPRTTAGNSTYSRVGIFFIDEVDAREVLHGEPSSWFSDQPRQEIKII